METKPPIPCPLSTTPFYRRSSQILNCYHNGAGFLYPWVTATLIDTPLLTDASVLFALLSSTSDISGPRNWQSFCQSRHERQKLILGLLSLWIRCQAFWRVAIPFHRLWFDHSAGKRSLLAYWWSGASFQNEAPFQHLKCSEILFLLSKRYWKRHSALVLMKGGEAFLLRSFLTSTSFN